jgi:hypothetical protein
LVELSATRRVNAVTRNFLSAADKRAPGGKFAFEVFPHISLTCFL